MAGNVDYIGQTLWYLVGLTGGAAIGIMLCQGGII